MQLGPPGHELSQPRNGVRWLERELPAGSERVPGGSSYSSARRSDARRASALPMPPSSASSSVAKLRETKPGISLRTGEEQLVPRTRVALRLSQAVECDRPVAVDVAGAEVHPDERVGRKVAELQLLEAADPGGLELTRSSSASCSRHRRLGRFHPPRRGGPDPATLAVGLLDPDEHSRRAADVEILMGSRVVAGRSLEPAGDERARGEAPDDHQPAGRPVEGDDRGQTLPQIGGTRAALAATSAPCSRSGTGRG